MKRGLWSMGVGLAALLLAAALPAAAQCDPEAWVKVYAVGDNREIGCADLAAVLEPVQTLCMGECLAGFTIDDIDAYRFCTPAGEEVDVSVKVSSAEICLGSPIPAVTSTPDPSRAGYGEIGQIIDVNVGLDILEKLVGYLGASNIRDYLALGFAAATLAGLLRPPSTPKTE